MIELGFLNLYYTFYKYLLTISIFPAKIKAAITDALLNIHKKSDWKSQFAKFGIIKFEHNSNVAYDGPDAQMWASSKEKLSVRYY